MPIFVSYTTPLPHPVPTYPACNLQPAAAAREPLCAPDEESGSHRHSHLVYTTYVRCHLGCSNYMHFTKTDTLARPPSQKQGLLAYLPSRMSTWVLNVLHRKLHRISGVNIRSYLLSTYS
ncbi:hypothetical protein LY76DRAFT_15548 [Colletotrichum caudatum]|nr:hypothetical protein LY76DRAFT_15548 [Colletotrichum caudatum]